MRYREGLDRPCGEHRRAASDGREIAAAFLPAELLGAAGLAEVMADPVEAGRVLAESLPDPAEAGRALAEAIEKTAAGRGSAHGGL